MEKTVIYHFKERVEEYTRERKLIPFPIDFKGRFLEVGCGARPSYSIDNLDFFGVDITPNMIRGFREAYQHVNLIICDVKFLPFKSSSFQVIVANTLLHHLIGSNPSKCVYNIDKAISEINRVLSPRGIFIIKELLARNYLYTLIIYYVTLTCTKFNIEINSLYIHSKVVTYFLTEKKLLSLLEGNEFHIEEIILDKWRLKGSLRGKPLRWAGFNLGKNVELHARAREII